jgi:NAD(P)-dependent dehydrogenase (short-subunit alcohol dehydrogenase family)
LHRELLNHRSVGPQTTDPQTQAALIRLCEGISIETEEYGVTCIVIHPGVVQVLFAFWHPVAGMQESVVQTLPSLQLGAGPPTQEPAAQVSAVVHAFPSLQGSELLAC